jgi:N-acetylmuramoyl-L-alanine amidase
LAGKGGKSKVESRKPKVKSQKLKVSRVEQVKKSQVKLARKWYAGLQERIGDFPVTDLKGRTIVIDPGHTNCSPGAEGPKKRIIEADVNWQVASRLAKLLNDAGARAVLTVPYGKPKPLDTRNTDQDLDNRAGVADREQADLFVSVHHNWSNDPAVNRLEMYYRLEDPGPSRDAANYILIHLARNTGLDGSLVPANYRVLHRNTRPALLTEASYISNPIQESLLALPAKQELEAEAIYLGILDYFAHGVPRYSLLTPLADVTPQVWPRLRVKVSDRFAPDRSTLRASFDGVPAKLDYLPAETVAIIVPTQALTNGKHDLRFESRNAQGNSGIPLKVSFTTDREPARIALLAQPLPCPPGKAVMEIRALVLDAEGKPVAGTRSVNWKIGTLPASGGVPIFSLGDSTLHDGSARIYLNRAKPGAVAVTVRSGKATAAKTVVFAQPAAPFLQLRFLSASENAQPVGNVVILDDWHGDSIRANPDGIATLEPSPGSHRFSFRAPAFRPASIEQKLEKKSVLVQDVRLEPVLAGALSGQRIALDPAGRWEQPDTTTELAGFNLAVAHCLEALLERAGAKVRILRADTAARSRPDRLILAGAFQPDLYLKLSARVRDPVRRTLVGHYPNSVKGAPLAEAIRVRLNTLRPLTTAEAIAERSYEITNAPAPAVGIYLRFNDTASQRIRSDTILIGDIAREVLVGLAQQRSTALNCRLTVRVTDPRSKPVVNALVILDDLLVYRTDARGEVTVPALDAGNHRLRAERPGYSVNSETFLLPAGTPNLARTLILVPTPSR